jgi:histidinol-phosphatase (PHP family)
MNRNSMVTTDYHMHSTFSPDGNYSVAEICRHAFDRGMTAIAITEHAEWYAIYPEIGFPRAADFLAEIERCRAEYGPRGLHVHSGVELGNPHQYAAGATHLLQTHNFEVVIASLHWLDGKNIHKEECFAGRDPYDVYTHYFIELGRMARDFEFDILAHLTAFSGAAL